MITREEWDSVYFSTMAMASVAVGAIGVALGLLALKSSQAQAVGVGSLKPPTGYTPLAVNIPRVHYDNGQVLVSVRNPGEWHELRDFIQPNSPDITRIVRSFHG